jgi:hypothetical protein
MFFARYDFPLPNNGDRYDLSQEELVKLLDSVYDRGYAHGVESTIKPETITATYDNLTVTLPVDDPDHLWNKDIYNSKYEVIDKAIDEIKLLETLVNVDKYSDSVYNSFRKEVCAGCNDPNCLKSQVEIYDCHKFENYYEV